MYTVAKSLKLKLQGGISHSCYDFRPAYKCIFYCSVPNENISESVFI